MRPGHPYGGGRINPQISTRVPFHRSEAESPNRPRSLLFQVASSHHTSTSGVRLLTSIEIVILDRLLLPWRITNYQYLRAWRVCTYDSAKVFDSLHARPVPALGSEKLAPCFPRSWLAEEGTTLHKTEWLCS